MVVAGVMLVDEEYCPIYVHLETGDCAFENPNTSVACLISEISVDDPLETTDVIQLERSVESIPGIIGIICKRDGKAIVIIDEDTAALRPLSNLTDGGEIINIDTSCDYEDDYED